MSSRQAEFRKTVYKEPVLWFVYYTRVLEYGSERDVRTVIKACSADEAKKILIEQLGVEFPYHRAKAITLYKLWHGFRKGYKFGNFNDLNVDDIATIAFPNKVGKLYHVEKQRPEGWKNRFNFSQPKDGSNNGFESGEKNWAFIHRKGKSLPEAERHMYRYKGKWIRITEEEKEKEKEEIRDALLRAEGNRRKACEYLGVRSHKLYKMMKRHPEVDWNKEIPKGGIGLWMGGKNDKKC